MKVRGFVWLAAMILTTAPAVSAWASKGRYSSVPMLSVWSGARVQAIHVFAPSDAPRAQVRVQVFNVGKEVTRTVCNSTLTVAAGDTLAIDSGYCVGKVRIVSILSPEAMLIEFPAKSFGWLPNTGADLVRTMIRPTSGPLGRGSNVIDGGEDYCVISVEPK